jgi:hypothetical protein
VEGNVALFTIAEAEASGTLRIGGDRALVERYLAAIKSPERPAAPTPLPPPPHPFGDHSI